MTETTPTTSATELRGRIAIVTGASSGIGQATAEALIRRGTHVAIAARREDRLHAMAERLAAPDHGEILPVVCDVRQPESVQALVKQTLDRWGRLDILVADAGFGWRGSLVEGDPARWKDLLDTNVFGLLLTLKYGLPPMLERGDGHVVVMSSVAGRVPTVGGSAYCGSKFAASAIADIARMEAAPKGVRITTIEPGVVISEFQQVADYPPDILPTMLKGAIPLVPADIARAIIYALEQPAHVGVGELVIRPAGQAYP
jgi:NADP-dependent 3-hydroxy acid dehydrogenase YdfG